MGERLTVVCVRWGDKYSADYVTRLRSMVARHLTLPHRFVCITANPIDGIDCVPEQCNFPAWWQKIGLFRPGFLEGPALYLDLDMIVVASIDWVGEFLEADLAAIENWGSRRREGPLYEDELSSALMIWRPGPKSAQIFEWFSMKDAKRLEPHGDQTFITEMARAWVTRIPQERIASYKRHIRGSSGVLANEISVVAFHGSPRPHEVAHEPWIQANWC